jgi:SAM-dependent methyltransferase
VLRRVPLSPDSKVLDAGCNNGNFLKELHARVGCRGFGIEMDAAAVRRANAHPALTVECGEIDERLPHDERYDLATLWHVLEHLPRPVETLRRLRRATKAGGHLVVAVPDSSGWTARLFGRVWFGHDAPRHLTHFTKETLCAALLAAGWRPLHCAHVVEVSTFAGSLHNLLRRRWCDDLPGNLLKWMGLQSLGLPFDHLFRLLGKGDWLIFIARKE